MLNYYPITPVAKPRMTKADAITMRKIRARRVLNFKETQRAPILRRWLAYCDEVKIRNVQVPECNAHVIFLLPFPDSWTHRMRDKLRGYPHRGKKDKARKNDIDNLQKSLLDAAFGDDSSVWDIRCTKIWHDVGGFFVLDEESIHIRIPFERETWLASVDKEHGACEHKRLGKVIDLGAAAGRYLPLNR